MYIGLSACLFNLMLESGIFMYRVHVCDYHVSFLLLSMSTLLCIRTNAFTEFKVQSSTVRYSQYIFTHDTCINLLSSSGRSLLSDLRHSS